MQRAKRLSILAQRILLALVVNTYAPSDPFLSACTHSDYCHAYENWKYCKHCA